MAEAEAKKRTPLPNESQKTEPSKDAEQTTASDAVILPTNDNCIVAMEGDEATPEVVAPGNEEFQQMSDSNGLTESTNTCMTSQVTDWSNASGYNMSFYNINMDPSVAIASSGRWANGSVYGPSNNTLRPLGDDSKMNLNDVDVDPSVAIAAAGVGDNGNVSGPSDNTHHHLELDHLGDDSKMNLSDVDVDPSVAIAAGCGEYEGGPSGNTLQASGDDRPGAPVEAYPLRCSLSRRNF